MIKTGSEEEWYNKDGSVYSNDHTVEEVSSKEADLKQQIKELEQRLKREIIRPREIGIRNQIEFVRT